MSSMVDLEDVIRSLFRQPTGPTHENRSVERLDNGAFHLDYYDPDHVYLVTVRQVPRIRLTLERPLLVGSVAGVRAELVQVSLANHIEVVLDAEQGPPREAASSSFMASYRQWEGQAERGSRPPPWPAEHFRRIALTVSDDIGTPYHLASGLIGGTRTEWEVRWLFRPTPPVTARRLTLEFTPPTGAPVKIDLSLPSP